MSDLNLAAVVYGAKDMRVEKCPIPDPGPGQVQLHMRHVGICCTDVHFWEYGGQGDYSIESPWIPGHEGAGVVTKLGDGVTGLKVGDMVALEPVMPCRHCDICKRGRYNLCSKRRHNAQPPTPGTLSRYCVHQADCCYKLPDHVTSEEGALLEPLTVAVHACSLGDVMLGSKVLICGAGTMGLVCLLTAKACGASIVCITDLDETRLEKAKELGADYTLKVTTDESRNIARDIEATIGEQPDATIECSGAISSSQAAIYATKPGGTVTQVGIGTEDITPIPLVDVVFREIQIKGVAGSANRYPTAVSMVASGKVNLKPLITHRFNLEDAVIAFETAHSGEGIKVMIKCSEG